MKFVESIAHRVTVLHQGKVLAEGDMQSVQANPTRQGSLSRSLRGLSDVRSSQSDGGLWAKRGPARHRSLGRRRRDRGAGRPQRHGQVDADEIDDRRDAVALGPDRRRRRRRHGDAEPSAGGKRSRLRSAGPADLRHHDGEGEHRDRPGRDRQDATSRTKSTTCFRSSRISSAGAAAISRAASSSSSRSRARSPAIRRCCCSTSRPRAFSRRSSRISRGCCATSASIRNLCIVVCEQVLSFVLDIADRILVMEGGRIVHADTRAERQRGGDRALPGGLAVAVFEKGVEPWIKC